MGLISAICCGSPNHKLIFRSKSTTTTFQNYHHHHHHHHHLIFRSRPNRVTLTATATAATSEPWLMLPPVVESGVFKYKFYSLKEDRVLTFNKRRPGGGEEGERIPPDDAKLVGSSHGWLAFLDEKSNHVFLSNPISDEHVKLPPIDTLPDPHINLFEGRGSISRLILSCSPNEQPEKDLFAITTFGPGRRIAVGPPWHPLGPQFQNYKPMYHRVKYAARPCEDFVHRHGSVFTSIQPCTFDVRQGYFVPDKYGASELFFELFHWDVTKNDHSHTSHRISLASWEWGEGEANLLGQCIQMPHLVCADHISKDNPLIVVRFLNRGIGDNGAPSDPKLARPDLYRAHINSFPYRSVRFVVLEIDLDEETINVCDVVEDLKGLAIFVGMNHSFAIPATGNLKPNSIYFSDAGRITPPNPDAMKNIYGGHDIGIFYYEKKTVSPCYYPCDFQSFKRIDPPPIWFTPNPIPI